MNPQRFDLISKSFLENLNEEEKNDLQKWKQQQDNKRLYDLLSNIRLDEEIDRVAEDMRSDILGNLHKKMDVAKKRVIRLRVLSLAASIALLIGFAGIWVYQSGKNRYDDQMITMSNPTGITKSVMVLPDGSTVVLHGNSTIRYSSDFIRKTRSVELDGEAFFDVMENKGIPFIVQSGKVQVKVLGTSFNVDAYGDEELVKVTLKTGQISLSVEDFSGELVLNPDQQAVYNKNTQEIIKRQVKAEEITGWIENRLYFNSLPLIDIARILERHFNVEITISPQRLESMQYTGEFIANESLDEILTVLSLDERIKYKREANTIKIYE